MSAALRSLTLRGGVFIIAGVTIVVIALLLGQRDLLRAGILVLALPLLSLILTTRSTLRLTGRREIEPARIAAGDTATVHLRISTGRRLRAGSVLVEEEVPPALGGRARFVLDNLHPRRPVQVEYPIAADHRGAYELGPLSARLTDVFGLIERRQTFSDTTTLLVTPRTEELPAVRLAGEWSGSGESRPRSVASAGEEDATLRAYRHGDDMRRVHWRASARFDELMVRREEQPWQSRTTVLLDTRRGGHAGPGRASSLEWGVSATASVAVHLVRRGYAVRLVTDDRGTEPHTRPGSGSAHLAVATPLLEALATVEGTADAAVANWQGLLRGAEDVSGLLIAVLGRLDPAEASTVAGLRHGATASFAVLQDVASWTDYPDNEREQILLAQNRQILERAGWKVTIARRGDPMARLWHNLDSRAGAHWGGNDFGPAVGGITA